MLIALMSFLSSCFPTSMISTPAPIEKQIIEYDFTPPEVSEKVDLSLILLNPQYASGFEYEKQEMFGNFMDNMANDFEEMLIAKGYSLRGPYDTYDEIVYADKTETDLMLSVEIDFSHQWETDIARRTRRNFSNQFIGYSYEYNGNVNIGGKINLTIKESLTQEKLWLKSIKLDAKKIAIQTARYNARSDAQGVNAIMNDPQYVTAMYQALDDYYQKALKTAWNHLEPQELEVLTSQVKELREKKGY
jgi:hypothetical protein